MTNANTTGKFSASVLCGLVQAIVRQARRESLPLDEITERAEIP